MVFQRLMMNYQLIQTVTEKAKGKAERKRQEKRAVVLKEHFTVNRTLYIII